MNGDKGPDKPGPLAGSLYGDVLAGYSPAMAAFRRGMSAVDAQAELRRAIEEHRANRVDAPDIELARLNELSLACADGVAAGDIPAIDQARKISAERRKFLGLDAKPDEDTAPQRVKVEFSFSPSGATVSKRDE